LWEVERNGNGETWQCRFDLIPMSLGGIMRARLKRWAMLGTGWFFIVVGIVGLFLPILQGVLFILIGLLILSSEYVWAHRLLEKLKQRFPTLAERAHVAAQSVRDWLHGCLRRISGSVGER
jgi:hypothetical protein